MKLRRSRNVVASQRDDRVRSKVHGKLSRHKIRHRVTTNGYGSARRHRGHLWAQLSKANLGESYNQDPASRSRLRPVEDRRVRRAAKEKECRALTVSRLRHNSTSSRSNGSKVARLPQPIMVKVTGSRKVETKGNQKKRLHHGRNNFSAITPAAPERKNSGVAFVVPRRFRARCSGV